MYALLVTDRVKTLFKIMPRFRHRPMSYWFLRSMLSQSMHVKVTNTDNKILWGKGVSPSDQPYHTIVLSLCHVTIVGKQAQGLDRFFFIDSSSFLLSDIPVYHSSSMVTKLPIRSVFLHAIEQNNLNLVKRLIVDGALLTYDL